MKYRVENLFNYHSSEFGIKKGDVLELKKVDGGDIYLSTKSGESAHFYDYMVCAIHDNQNREYLRDFIKLNQIKTTLVSRSLCYSRNWLTQAMNRTDRGDLTDEELQAIMKQLQVDWTQDTFVHVKATKTHSAYRTRPCVYEHAKHKELLQRAFWDGRFVGLKA